MLSPLPPSLPVGADRDESVRLTATAPPASPRASCKKNSVLPSRGLAEAQWERCCDGMWVAFRARLNTLIEASFQRFWFAGHAPGMHEGCGADQDDVGAGAGAGRPARPHQALAHFHESGVHICFPQMMEVSALRQRLKVRRRIVRDVYPDPRAWVAMQGNDRLVSLAASDPDWCTVSSLLTRNLKCTVLQVERVQNRSLWQRFTHHSSLMLHRCDDGVNERWLWHGTSATPPSTLTTGFEGIDLRLAGVGWYGRGIYFAESAAYSDSTFAHHTTKATLEGKPTACKQLLLVRVLCGREYQCGTTVSDATRNLVRPPRGYDSLVAGPHRPHEGAPESTIRVVYESACTYPAFVVTYHE